MILFRRTVALLAIAFSLIGNGYPNKINAKTEEKVRSNKTHATSDIAQTPTLDEPDVVYVPTPPEVVERMLTLANVQQDDILYDLGSGDGRIPIAAVENYNVNRAVGIDIDPQRIQEANANARQAGVSDRVEFLNQDLFKTNFSDATVVTLYLLKTLNVKLRPQLLQQLEPGTRIVSHDFDMGEWIPERTEQVEANGRTHTIYMWTVPENPPANLVSKSNFVFPLKKAIL